MDLARPTVIVVEPRMISADRRVFRISVTRAPTIALQVPLPKDPFFRPSVFFFCLLPSLQIFKYELLKWFTGTRCSVNDQRCLSGYPNSCVDCLTGTDCPTNEPICTSSNKCVQCSYSSDCNPTSDSTCGASCDFKNQCTGGTN